MEGKGSSVASPVAVNAFPTMGENSKRIYGNNNRSRSDESGTDF
jgi:hypothetical protein